MHLTIRRSRFADLDEILKIEKASFPDPYDRLTFLHLLLSEPGGFLVAAENGVMLGYAVTTTMSDRKGLIVSIAVSPDHQRRGIGTKLLQEALDYLVGRGVERVELQVRVTNTVAIQMYERKFSFRISHRIRRYYQNGEDALVMIKQF